MKKEKIEPRFKQRKLFDRGPVEEVKIIAEPTKPVENKTAIVKQSEIDGWTSIYQPEDGTDRFVLISPKGERFACKFYNRPTDDFIGASFMSMVSLREHFDRSIIPVEVGLK